MGLTAFNLIVGAPIFSIWVGSRVQGDSGGISMTALLVVVVVLAVLAWLLIRLLDLLGRAHDRAAGIERRRRQTGWLRSLSGERRDASSGERATALDMVLVVFVVLAVIAFELWLLLFAGSPLPH
jgi:hypothetical protein